MSKASRTSFLESFFLYLVLGISSLVILALAIGYRDLNIDSAFALPLVLIFGVIDVFIVLTLAGKIFINTSYGCKDEALGLPSGSVRALIALSLIIIFAIMAIFMYNQLSPSANMLHVSANQTVIFANGTAFTNTGGDTYVLADPSQAQRDFSGQTLTTVSTLVVALSGFYFGTKAVATAKGKESSEDPLSITPTGPKIKIGAKETLPITVESDPENQKITVTVKGDDPSTLKQSDKNSKIYQYTPSEKAELAVLEFAWTSDSTISKSLIVEIEKEKKTSEGQKTPDKETADEKNKKSEEASSSEELPPATPPAEEQEPAKEDPPK